MLHHPGSHSLTHTRGIVHSRSACTRRPPLLWPIEIRSAARARSSCCYTCLVLCLHMLIHQRHTTYGLRYGHTELMRNDAYSLISTAPSYITPLRQIQNNMNKSEETFKKTNTNATHIAGTLDTPIRMPAPITQLHEIIIRCTCAHCEMANCRREASGKSVPCETAYFIPEA